MVLSESPDVSTPLISPVLKLESWLKKESQVCFCLSSLGINSHWCYSVANVTVHPNLPLKLCSRMVWCWSWEKKCGRIKISSKWLVEKCIKISYGTIFTVFEHTYCLRLYFQSFVTMRGLGQETPLKCYD